MDGDDKEFTIRADGSPAQMHPQSRSPLSRGDEVCPHTPNGAGLFKTKTELVDEPMSGMGDIV